MLRCKGAHGGRSRRVLRRLALVLALAVVAAAVVTAPARAQEPVRIGMGFGLAFLPIFLCEDLKLIEKHGKDAHLNLKATYQRFLGAGPLQDAAGFRRHRRRAVRRRPAARGVGEGQGQPASDPRRGRA